MSNEWLLYFVSRVRSSSETNQYVALNTIFTHSSVFQAKSFNTPWMLRVYQSKSYPHPLIKKNLKKKIYNPLKERKKIRWKKIKMIKIKTWKIVYILE